MPAKAARPARALLFPSTETLNQAAFQPAWKAMSKAEVVFPKAQALGKMIFENQEPSDERPPHP